MNHDLENGPHADDVPDDVRAAHDKRARALSVYVPVLGNSGYGVRYEDEWIADGYDTQHDALEAALAAVPNPVVRRTSLRAYPGWVVREYADGMFDATDGKGLSPGFESFEDTIAHLRAHPEEIR